MSDEYNEPPIEFTNKELAVILLLFVFLFFEFKYMYVWCKWFTNC